MRRTPCIPITVACALTLATSAHAQGGINLSWGDCGSFGYTLERFACDTNVGVHTLVASFAQSVPLDQMVGLASQIELQVEDPVLSPWWDFTTNTGCRRTQFGSNANFLTGHFNCSDPWQGQAVGGQDFQVVPGDPNHGRIRVVYGLPSGVSPIHIDSETEYYAFEVVIRNGLTTGSGSCAGCLSRACILLDNIHIYQPVGVGDWTWTNPLVHSVVSWQRVSDDLCVSLVPAKRPSWGAIKSLYR